MFRNGGQLTRNALCTKYQQKGRTFSNDAAVRWAKNTSLQRQGNIMNKLFGSRVSGSKKRWIPNQEGTAPAVQGVLFKASQFGKTTTGFSGKTTQRRVTVLNKLFMKHISDLLATGETSEAVLGRGLQIQRVKISPDFSAMNVYWLASGAPLEDGKLEMELQRCSGLLRHELSQLALMGEVPRIKFVRDKTHANLNEVNALLLNMDFGPEEDEQDNEELKKTTLHTEQSATHRDVTVSIVKREFFGQAMPTPAASLEQQQETSFPEMRHDVLGLDHRAIMTKILTKMRKSKQAWELHNHQRLNTEETVEPAESSEQTNTTAELERARKKLVDAAESATNFDKFLATRRDRKNTPERKKYSKAESLDLDGMNADVDADVGLSARQRRQLHEEDYLHEENESERKT